MPNSEYENDSASQLAVNARVEISSSQSDLTGSSLFETILATVYEEEENAQTVTEEAGSEGEYIFCCDGSLKRSGGRVKLTYQDSLPDLDGAVTEISFQRKNPGIITVTRTGDTCHSFVIEQGVRQYSIYTTPYGPIEMCIWGRRVENRLDDNGGTIVLDYAVELKGMTAQRTKMTIKATKNN